MAFLGAHSWKCWGQVRAQVHLLAPTPMPECQERNSGATRAPPYFVREAKAQGGGIARAWNLAELPTLPPRHLDHPCPTPSQVPPAIEVEMMRGNT